MTYRLPLRAFDLSSTPLRAPGDYLSSTVVLDDDLVDADDDLSSAPCTL